MLKPQIVSQLQRKIFPHFQSYRFQLENYVLLKKMFSIVLKKCPLKRGQYSMIERYDQEPEHKKVKPTQVRRLYEIVCCVLKNGRFSQSTTIAKRYNLTEQK